MSEKKYRYQIRMASGDCYVTPPQSESEIQELTRHLTHYDEPTRFAGFTDDQGERRFINPDTSTVLSGSPI